MQIAALAGVDQTGVSRWLNGTNVPRAEAVIKLARALQRSPVEALVAAGHITLTEVGLKPDLKSAIRELSDDQLIAEIRRRISAGGQRLPDDVGHHQEFVSGQSARIDH